MAELRTLLSRHLAALLGVESAALDPNHRFSQLGVDSARATALMLALSQELGRKLSPALVWELPTLDSLARHLAGDEGPRRPAATTPAADASSEPVAVIGLACRFPGGGEDPAHFWQQLCEGVDGIGPVPPDRWDMGAWYDPDPSAPGKMFTLQAGFLGSVDRFDASFFEISPREAAQVDPQQRLALELAWEALEDAGVPARSLAGCRVGVYMGAIWRDYAELAAAHPEGLTLHSGPGQALDVIANRISYVLGLMGPSLTVDTACSSSLVAVHLAACALRSGECELALAGGVSLMLSPATTVALCKLGALAPDGRCKTFSARADGFGRGEGGGVAVLKLLSAALRDGDPIYAVVRGSAVNNDGPSSGLTAPNPRAQEEVLAEAWSRAGLDPTQATYVEAHGTGTQLGDTIEARVLASVFTRGRAPDAPPLQVGAVKTNLGHLEAAAGIAGFLKTALALRHREIPANLHVDELNPDIPFEELRLEVPTARRPWGGPPLAGVSSFGWGGTNCHVVLEGPPGAGAELLLLGAPDEAALAERLAELSDQIERSPSSARELGAAAARRGAVGPARVGLVFTEGEALAPRLRAAAAGSAVAGVSRGRAPEARRPIVFVMSPQGGQWRGMGVALLRDPVAGDVLRRCDARLRALSGWSLVEELSRAAPGPRSREADVVQPTLIVLQMALAERLFRWGIEPDLIVGHSLGEISAAWAAGVLSLEDALTTLFHYTRLQATTAGNGGMAVVDLTPEELAPLLAPLEGRAGVAGQNGLASTLLTGEPLALEQVLAEVRGRGVFGARVDVNVAAHGPQIDPILEELRGCLAGIRPRPATRPLWSSSTGEPLVGPECDGAYWARNLRDRVRFAEAIVRGSAGEPPLFVELNAHPILGHAIRQTLAQLGRSGAVLCAGRRGEPEDRTLREVARELWVAGASLSPEAALPADRGGDARLAEARPRLLPLSAHTPEALRARARDVLALLRRTDGPGLDDQVYTASVRRSHGPCRLAAPAASRDVAASALEGWLGGREGSGVQSSEAGTPRDAARPRVVFVFPGQGSQWVGMGRQLYAAEEAFRAALDRCDAAVSREAGWSVVEEIHADAPSSRLEEIDVAQPLLFAMSVSLAALWRSWGVEPDAVVGHSMGEIAASCVAGALSLDDATAVICRRSRLLKRAVGLGAMAIAELSLEETSAAILGYEGRVAVAGSNSPQSTLLSGELAALEELSERFARREIFFRIVRAPVPSHSPKVAFLEPDLLAELSGIQPRAGEVPIHSTVTGEGTDGADQDARYWVRNLLEPVRFSQCVQRLAADGHRIFLEVSPHPVLLGALRQTLAGLEARTTSFGSLRRDTDERAALLEGLGAAYASGVDPRWEALSPTAAAVVPLPVYPWQRERFWLEAPRPERGRRPGADGHPLLGEVLSDSLHVGGRIWQARLGAEEHPWILDHRVHDAALLPAAAFLELGRVAASQALGTEEVELVDVSLLEAMLFPEDRAREVQTVWTPLGSGGGAIHLSSREADQAEPAWTLHVTARARRSTGGPEPVEAPAREGEHVPGAQLHAGLRAAGFQYGPSFLGLAELWRSGDRTLGRVVPPPGLAAEVGRHGLHPAVLDAALQACLPLLVEAGQGGAWVPVSVGRWRLDRRVEGELWSAARLRAPARAAEPAELDVVLHDRAGARVGSIERLRLQPLEAAPRAGAGGPYLGARWVEAPALEARPLKGGWLVIASAGPRADALAAAMRAQGAGVVRVSPRPDDAVAQGLAERVDASRPEPFEQLLARRFSAAAPCAGVVLAPGLDDPLPCAEPPEALSALVEESLACALHLVQALGGTGWRRSPQLFLVSRGAVPAGGEARPHHAPLLGLGAVLPYEHPELKSKRVDLSVAPEAVELEALVRELGHEDREEAVALRGPRRLVGRFSRWTAEDRPAGRTFPARGRPFRLALARVGTLEGVHGRPLARQPPAPDEVEIEVEAAGLNFFDVVRAMGLVPGLRDPSPELGVECAGRVAAVGARVQGLAVGDPVVAFAAGSLASHVRARAEHVAPRPHRLSVVQAAAAPAVFTTAWYALGHVARLSAGERVLIHSGAGGTGLAAIRIAQSIGAEIYATAGSEAKRAWLRELGVRHVYDSRALDFGGQILADTGGEGVDVVLNSLAGEAIEESLRALSADGRFLELGKRDIYADRPLGLQAFKRRLSFAAIDLLGLSQERPARFGRLLGEVMEALGSGRWEPLPVEVFPASAAGDALRKMARGAHVGKLVIQVSGGGLPLMGGGEGPPLWAEGTWLLTGGLGGLGLSLAGWLVERGVRHLVLAGRSGAARPEQREALARLAAAGATVEVAALDVSSGAEVHALLDRVEQRLPPIRGIVHAAMVLEDGTLREQRMDRVRAALAPKVLGAWNLHQATLDRDLDAFVLYSSVASTLGSPGQGNYMAGNAFLDALAHHRRGLGLPALSINWGAFTGVGGAAAQVNRGDRLAARGLEGMTPGEGERWLGELLGLDTTQVTVAKLDARQWVEFHPQVAGSRWLSELARAGSTAQAGASAGLRGSLSAAGPGERPALVAAFVRRQAALVLRLEPERVDVHAPLKSLGVDSLMGLELRNRLEAGLELTLPATLIWNHPNVAALTRHLVDCLGLGDAPPPPPPEPAPPAAVPPEPAPDAQADLDALSDEELMAKLASKLTFAGDLDDP